MPRDIKNLDSRKGRRGNNEGTIFQRKDGRWCGQVTSGYDDDGKLIRKTVYGRTRIEVGKKIAEMTHNVFSAGYQANGDPALLTVEAVAREWLFDFKQGTVTSRTFNWYHNLVQSRISSQIGATPVTDVTTYHVQQLFNNMARVERLSVKTIKDVRLTLNQIMKHAIDMKVITENPVLKTKIIKPMRHVADEAHCKAVSKSIRPKLMAAAAKNAVMHPIIMVLMFAGLRSGELLALKWKHIDFAEAVISVEGAVTVEFEFDQTGKRISRTSAVSSTKTVCSVRKIKVGRSVMETLRIWREAQAVKELSLGKIFTDKDSFVFPSRSGELWKYAGFYSAFRRFVKKNGFEEHGVHPHALRHTFGTILLERGVNPKTVMEMMGHANIETTLSIYSHVLREVFDATAETLDDVYSDIIRDMPTADSPENFSEPGRDLTAV
jgi:integrase